MCKGNPYGKKADIWSIGCVLYELIALKRPFHHDQLNSLFEQIINKDPPPLPADTDPELLLLTNILLQKDPERRPNVWQLLEMDFIKKHVERFLETLPEDNNYRLELRTKKDPIASPSSSR